MTKEEAKKAAEVLSAYVEGKEIQFRGDDDALHNEWQDNAAPTFNFGHYSYRIKPESKYRPFNNAEECWEEMKKHEPFGWVKSRDVGYYNNLESIDDDLDKEYYFLNFTFADGTPFGKLTEEE